MIAAIVLGSLGNTTSPTGSDGASIPSVTRAACAHYVSVIPERVELDFRGNAAEMRRDDDEGQTKRTPVKTGCPGERLNTCCNRPGN